MSLFIQSVSTKLPTNFISNREFCFLTHPEFRPDDFNEDSADEWIFTRSGIKTRPYFDLDLVGQGPTNLNIEAKMASELIEASFSHEAWEKIDAIITVRSSPFHAIPSLSQRTLSLANNLFLTPEKSLFTLDLFQPSTGVLSALKTARHLPFKNILILVSEFLSPLLNLKDPGTSMLFGDAIAAVLITKEKDHQTAFKVLGESFESKADLSHALHSEQSFDSFKMKGPELFRKIVPEFKRSSLALLEYLHLSPQEIDFYLPHQANSRIIERAAHSMHFHEAQVLSNIERVGNLSSASMMVLLHESLQQNKIKPGSKTLLNSCGAGITTGAAVIEKL
jgi:3-oxoacyl-[acyl-carrier-protein] synthase-3